MTFQDLTHVLKDAQVEVLAQCDESKEIVVRSRGKMKVIKDLGKDLNSSRFGILFDRIDDSAPRLDLILGDEYQASI